MSKILITGCKGQLGYTLSQLLPEVWLTDVGDLDITNRQAVYDFVKTHDIGVIINCAAYTAVDNCEEQEDLAWQINVEGPRNLAMSGAKIVHISTDYVFDGTNCIPYCENDKPNPQSVYGRTKLAGEKVVLENSLISVVIRTAWLYSPYGNNFVKTMWKLGAEKGEINVVVDQIGTPTYALNLAQAIIKIIPQMNEKNRGVYHFTDEGVCSWYDLASEIMMISGLPCKINAIPSSAYPMKAKRPHYSVLSKQKIRQTFGIEIQHWRKGLEQCLKLF